MDRFEDIETFVRVARTQSFGEAARQLRVVKSVVSRRIKKLEDFVGAPLFHRSTRTVRLSDVGQALLPNCIGLMNRANDVLEQMRGAREGPEGSLKVHVVPGFVLGDFASLIHRFQSAYPAIRLELMVSDEIVDPINAGFDCTLQIFPAASTELVSRVLFPVRRVFCATPEYLRTAGTPQTPGDLHQHKLGLYSGYPTRDRWTFHRGTGSETHSLSAALLSNNVQLLREYAYENSGIVCLPTLVADAGIRNAGLLVVLPTYQLSTFALNAVYAATSRNAFKLKLFIEHLSAAFSGAAPWDDRMVADGLLPTTLLVD